VSDRAAPFARVLVGVDGSARGDEATRQAAALALPAANPVVLVHAIDANRPHDEDVEAGAEEALGRAAAVIRQAGGEPDARMPAGDPGEVLVEEAREHGIDLVCVGPDSSALGGALRFGRVATHVVREAPCSVLIARPAGPAFPSTILCGVDGSDASVGTAKVAAAIALASGAELHLVHVVPVFRGRDAEWTLGADEESPPELERSVEAVRRSGVEPVRDMAMGRPEHALVAGARRLQADLVVVGHRGLGPVKRRLLGSVSEHCASHAPCSVLVVRARDA
jgi:nucleotide-binding universal stress UspA family protein